MNTSSQVFLHFDQSGQAYWRGRLLVAEDLRPVLAIFDSIINRHLLAWVERRILAMPSGILPESGVLAQMAGMKPLISLLNELENSLMPEAWFEDCLESIPERPAEPAAPKKRRYAKGSQLAEIEDIQYQRALKHFQSAHLSWETEDSCWFHAEPDFLKRIAKFQEFRLWKKDRQCIEDARIRVISWERRLKESYKMSAWEFFPPGAGLEYTFEWVKIYLNRRFPETRFDLERISTLIDFHPQVLHFGSGDFNGYIAFVFPNGRVALESPVVGNALYLFHSDWIDLSRKPKEILIKMMKEGDRRIMRYFHADGGNLRTWLDVRLRGLA